jgi:telomerase reverse transcriptase
MTKKRKRSRSSTHDIVADPRKKVKADIQQVSIQHPTLCLYYTQISTLRKFVLSKLPTSSKARRRRIGSAVEDFFDRTLVCMVDLQQPKTASSRSKDFETFSQHFTLTARSSIVEGSTSQSELMDFAIWLLFYKVHQQVHRPPHMLCHGYQRAGNPRRVNEDHCAVAGILGLVSHYPNENVDTLKNGAWTELLGLLGKEGDRIMLDLVLECGIFVAVDGCRGNFYQLSGANLLASRRMKFTQCFQVPL